MKVGIFTFPNSVSYGATLQMYALSRAIETLGHEAEVINYHNAFMKAEKHCKHTSESKIKHSVKRIVKKALHGKLYKGFRAFEKDAVNLYPQKSFSDVALLTGMIDRYGAVICGSDQVWNPNITNSDLSYFLNFCGEKTRRISYAPSFGVEELPDELKDPIRKELDRFTAISVREAQGQELLRDILDKDVPVVLDPSMLLEKSEWEKMESPYRKVAGDFVLYFTVKSSRRFFEKCRDFAKNNGLKMVVVGGNSLKAMQKRDPVVHYAVDISPKEWLWLIHNAKYVATNSFHGTAFSVIYEKDFYLELPPVTNSRLINMVRIMGLEERVLAKETEITPSTVDYTAARENMRLLREQSMTYLKDALCEDTANG